MKPLFYYLLLLFLPEFCFAQSTWTGTSPVTIAKWGVAGNWSNGVPGNGVRVTFNTTVSITENVPLTSGNDVRIQGSLTIANGVSIPANDLEIFGGTLINNGSFTVHNITYSNAGGTITNNQTLSANNLNVGNGSNAGTFNNNGTLTVTMDIVVDEGTFDNNSSGNVNSAGLDVRNGGIVLNGGNFISSGNSSNVQLTVLDGGFFTNESSGTLTVDFSTSNAYAIKVGGGFTNNGNITVGHTPFNTDAQGILNQNTGDFINTGSIVFRIDPDKCIIVDNHGMNGSYSHTGTMTRITGKNCDRLLPINLSSFNGKSASGYNDLNWTFENESDPKVCHLERSVLPENNHWTSIAQFGNSVPTVLTQNYSFKDYSAFPLSYYRLKSIDTRGEVFYSEMISIKNTSVRDQVLIYPIPANQYLHIKYNIPNETSILHIFTAAGASVKKINFVPGSGSASGGTLDIKELSSGVYYLMLTESQGVNNSLYKFVKTD